ncbi:MAG: TetR/AcrR family transcriptional regulator [Hamadaea sp.]|uniref:TetR/AcrR family transcriptional regulator n=1 Tax=Hamadaea sp. TaxID=2024425 RepID=UPI00178D5BBF|nr:TetR/AcrR family transcriptional regulator [Hamadaea sp.]NUT18666.1 TetR/AcrR family transcriptional regulator [Hamadaea sp.]
MANSEMPQARSSAKRRRLSAAAAQVLHQRGVERTTIADIARAADVPVGNVYYYFKTKDDLVHAALAEQAQTLAELTAVLEETADPIDRLHGLIDAWISQREIAARYGCPTGSLATEIDKRDEGDLDAEAGRVMRLLLDWCEKQFTAAQVPDPAGHALTLVSAYQGMSLMANALREPEVMTREGTRLHAWLESLRP